MPAPTIAPTAGDVGSGFPTIPDGAVYTLYCTSITSVTHVPDSERLKQQLIVKTGSRNWYVIHSADQSVLYYGFYKTFDDKSQPEEKARAQANRQAVRRLQSDNGDMPFAECGFVPLMTPDPPAPPEWDLRNAAGYWALQIAAYEGSPLRKKYAVDAVREARASGVPAYYYHGPTISSVLIGTWAREAVKDQDASTAQSDDPNKLIVVLDRPLPEGYKSDNLHTADGRSAKVLVPRVEVVDPTLKAAMLQYRENAVNGEVHMRQVPTDKGTETRPDPSFLVQIPHDDVPAGQ
jgi:hypothetical protein